MRSLSSVLFVGLCLFHQAASAGRPKTLQAELRRAEIPLSSVSVVVQDSRNRRVIISHNAKTALNPASAMKLVTTLAGLEKLGPAYRWKTEAYLDGKLENGVLHGNLVFKGYGDPKLTIEQFWLWLRELRQRGLREIRGDILVDRSFFDAVSNDPAAFDNKPTRAYNVVPNALLLNFNALHLRLIPDAAQTRALLEPDLSGYDISNRVTTAAQLPCNGGDTYTTRLEQRTIVLDGAIPDGCGEIEDFVAPLSHDEYFFAVFSALWKELGGTLHGKLREGRAPAGPAVFSTHFSPPLSEVIRDINKFSNNTMARQLFLTLGTADGLPANTARSTAAVQQWLSSQQLDFPELVLENGSGLSRTERISAQHLADILQYAAKAPFAAELEASLPILGMDGTAKKRFKDSEIAGYAHLKTGTLDGVKSFAGYINSDSGKRLIAVFIINHANASGGQAAQDALIEWVQKQY